MTVEDHTGVPVADLLSLAGRTAVVTGGGSGIGAAIAGRFAEAGAVVVVADVDAETAETVATEIAANGGRATPAAVDVAESTEVDALAAAVVAAHDGLDVWVNNAGVYPSRPFLEMSDREWARVLDINLNGAFYGARAAARHMTELDRPGAILNIASVSGYRGRKGLAHYSTSKHGLRGLTRSLAVELGPSNIRVLGLAPTMTHTPGTAAAMGNASPDPGRHDTEIYAHLPLGRPAVPDDIARVALFCVSDLAALMTGSTIAVDAGQMSM